MRRPGNSIALANSVGDFTGTIPVAVSDLCKGHGVSGQSGSAVANYDSTTGVVTCNDGVSCKLGDQQVSHCSDTLQCSAGKIVDAALVECVIDPASPDLQAQISACNAVAYQEGKHWDPLHGCVFNVQTAQPGDPCAVGSCPGEINGAGACIQNDPKCVAKAPAGAPRAPSTGKLAGLHPSFTVLLPPSAAETACKASKGHIWKNGKCVAVQGDATGGTPPSSPALGIFLTLVAVAGTIYLATGKR